jgi:hypothetical protein
MIGSSSSVRVMIPCLIHGISPLLYHAEREMCDTRGLDHPRSFQFNVLSAEMVEQPPSFTEEYGHEVNVYFVKQPSF